MRNGSTKTPRLILLQITNYGNANMKIDIRAIDEFLPFYVPAIVAATMATCEACALHRQLTAEEVEELAEQVGEATYWFMRKYKTLLTRNGASISDDEYNELYQGIYERIFLNASTMIDRATKEVKKWNPTNEKNNVSNMRQGF